MRLPGTHVRLEALGQRTTVLLKDFSDYGNAARQGRRRTTPSCSTSPRSSQAFETFSAGRALLHAVEPRAHPRRHDGRLGRVDARWRRFFHGKPDAGPGPSRESILYNYLATPRVNVPRWYLEGSAVFMETWMAGGYGRAQGAYDEMVFRAMVRDNARFYSPLGLEAEGTQIDFQVGVNDYLYGTRFMSYLALTRSPEKVIDVAADATTAARAITRPSSSACSASRSTRSGASGSPGSTTSRSANLASVEAYPTDAAAPAVADRAGLGLALILRSGDRHPDRRVSAIPASSPTSACCRWRPAQIRRLADIKGPMLYQVTSLAYDPQTRTRLVHHRQLRLPRPDAAGRHHRQDQDADRATGASATSCSTPGTGPDLGPAPPQRPGDAGAHRPALYRHGPRSTPSRTARSCSTSTSRRTATLLSASVGEINGDQSVRVFQLGRADARADPNAVAELKLGQARRPRASSSRPTASTSTAAPTTPASRTSTASSWRPRRSRRSATPSTGLFRPIPQADGSLIAFEYHRPGLRAGQLRPAGRWTTSARSSSSAPRSPTQHPMVKTWAVGSPAKIPLDSMITQRGKYVPLNEMSLGRDLSGGRGLQGTAAIGWHCDLRRPYAVQPTAGDGRLFAGGRPAASRAVARRHRVPHLGVGLSLLAQRVGFLRPVRADRPQPQGRRRHRRLQAPADLRSAAQLDFTAEAAVYLGLDTLPGAQNVSSAADRDIDAFKASLTYTDDDQVAGRGRRRARRSLEPRRRGRPRRRRRLPAGAGGSTSASRSAGSTPRSGSTARPARPAAIPPIRWAPSISALSATTTSMTARSSAIASSTVSRASLSTRSPRAGSPNRWPN